MNTSLALMFIIISGTMVVLTGALILIKSFICWLIGEPKIEEQQTVEMVKEIAAWKVAAKTLGISQNDALNQDVVKKAFRKMAMKHHPDHGGSAEQFNKIKQAYDYLNA